MRARTVNLTVRAGIALSRCFIRWWLPNCLTPKPEVEKFVSKRILCGVLFALLLGCSDTQNRQRESLGQPGQTPTVQRQPSSEISAENPVFSPTVPPETSSASQPGKQHAKRPKVNPLTSEPPAAPAPEAGIDSADAGDEPPPPDGEQPLSTPKPHLIVPVGTVIRVRLAQTVDTKHVHAGDRFSATLDAPILVHNRTAVPKGTTFEGHITEAKASGRLRGRGILGLALDYFRLHGATYSVQTSADVRTTSAHKKRNLAFVGGGSGVGAGLGAIAGGGFGAAIGAGAGAVAGTTSAFITGKRNVKLPVETPLQFSLRSSVDVGA